MAPITQASDETNHQALLDRLDIYTIRRSFRKDFKTGRRNKTVKQIISEAQRKEASMQPTQNNSGSSTPAVLQSDATGTQTPSTASTPANGVFSAGNIAHATQRLDRLVLERNQMAAAGGLNAPGMSVTYTNIESAPSMHPSSQRRYCDITGLFAPYTDPKTRLRYHNMEVFAVIRQFGQSTTEQYLAARGAHTVLK